MATVRSAAFAGSFYPADPHQLAELLTSLLAAASVPAGPSLVRPQALIVPHAGYIYSGPTAASGYRLLQLTCGDVKRVVLLGPSHRYRLDGLAAPTVDAWHTPLGPVPVATLEPDLLDRLPQLSLSDAPHAGEHSLEVQLPFLHTVLPGVPVLPLVVGRASAESVADVLEAVAERRRTVIVVSSDLSHYLSYRQAQLADAATLGQLLELNPPLTHQQACGATPVNGLLEYARRRGLAPTLLDSRNSGDTAGDRRRVVGYACLAFTGTHRPGPEDPLTGEGDQ